KNVRKHFSTASATMGVPKEVKTDSGPAYVAKSTQDFFNLWGIKHITVIPHFPTGQVITERANKT
ncbi:POK6 protein, partial [Formicarius rufipectus]|nr:POK6 protein [Formicarius rufipectus]